MQRAAWAPEATSCARFRFSTADGLASTGLAADGEIEDYAVAVGAEDPILGVAKELSSVEPPGNSSFGVLFLVTLANRGNVALFEVQVVQDLAEAFSDAEEGFMLDFVESDDFAVKPAFGRARTVARTSALQPRLPRARTTPWSRTSRRKAVARIRTTMEILVTTISRPGWC